MLRKHEKSADGIADEWWSARKIPHIAGLAALIVVVLFGFFFYIQTISIEEETEMRLDYFARSIEQSSSRLLDAASSDLNALDITLNLIGVQGGGRGASNITPMLAAWTGDRPWIQSVAILSSTGTVLFSSIASEVGQSVNLQLLGKLPSPEQNTQQGPVLLGRWITELKALDASDPATKHPLLALVRNSAHLDGSNVYLVALVNLDYFSNSFDLLMGGSGTQVALLSYSGVVMAGTQDIGTTPRQLATPIPIFTDFLPQREQGTYRGLAIAGQASPADVPALIAFRSMRNWPTLVVVQRPTALLLAQLMTHFWSALLAFASILLLIVALSLLALRSYRRRVQWRNELEQRTAEKNAAVVRDTAIQKSALDAIVIIDAQDRVLSFNPAAEAIFGYRASEVMGRSMADALAPPGLRDAHKMGLQRFIQTGKSTVLNTRRETMGRRADGSLFPMEIGVVSIEMPTGLHFIGTIRDITLIKDEQARSMNLMRELDLTAKELVSKNLILEQSNQRELQIAQHIQSSILVSKLDNTDPRVWIAAFNQASEGVDGDFFEVLTVGENCFDIVTGDVMGKGIPAALLGAATKLQLSRSLVALLLHREHSAHIPEPNQVIADVSRHIAPNLQSLNAFVTLVYIRVDLSKNTLTWVGCGHEEALLIRHNASTCLLANQQPPLGVLLDESFEQSSVEFGAGDSLFLSSDGASDAVNLQGQRIGRDRVNQSIQGILNIHHSPSMALHTLRRKLLTHNVTLKDDLTLVLLTRPLRQNLRRLEVPIALESLRSVRLFIEPLLESAGLDEGRTGTVCVAAAEVLTNAIRHAKGTLSGAPMELIVEWGGEQLVIEFRYIGDYFHPPEELPETDFGAFPEGGFGLHIIRQATDRVEYLHKDGVNTIKLWVCVEGSQG